MRSIAALLLAVLCAGCRVLDPSVEPGRTATIRGTVRDVAGDYLDIHSRSGLVVRVRVDKGTRFVARDRDVSPDCVTPGTRLAAIAVADARGWRATKVLLVSGSCTRSEP
jgi:hypothetical protein